MEKCKSLNPLNNITCDLEKGHPGNHLAFGFYGDLRWEGDCSGTLTNDPTSHPSHYTSGKIEVIDFIEDQKLDFHLGNVIKYVCRYGKKDGSNIVDLKKANWYLKRFIDLNSPNKEK